MIKRRTSLPALMGIERAVRRRATHCKPFDELNQSQQKKILHNERVRPILEMYGIDTGESNTSGQSETDYTIPNISKK